MNYFVDITDTLDKNKAIGCYSGEMEVSHPRSVKNLISSAEKNGVVL